MTETVILALVCLAAIAAVAVVLALVVRGRSRSDAALMAKLTDQLIANSDYQIRRMEIEAQIADAAAKERAARELASRVIPNYTPTPHVNGDLTAGEIPEYETGAR